MTALTIKVGLSTIVSLKSGTQLTFLQHVALAHQASHPPGSREEAGHVVHVGHAAPRHQGGQVGEVGAGQQSTGRSEEGIPHPGHGGGDLLDDLKPGVVILRLQQTLAS